MYVHKTVRWAPGIARPRYRIDKSYCREILTLSRKHSRHRYQRHLVLICCCIVFLLITSMRHIKLRAVAEDIVEDIYPGQGNNPPISLDMIVISRDDGQLWLCFVILHYYCDEQEKVSKMGRITRQISPRRRPRYSAGASGRRTSTMMRVWARQSWAWPSAGRPSSTSRWGVSVRAGLSGNQVCHRREQWGITSKSSSRWTNFTRTARWTGTSTTSTISGTGWDWPRRR